MYLFQIGMVKFSTADDQTLRKSQKGQDYEENVKPVSSFNPCTFLNCTCTRETQDVLKMLELKHYKVKRT